MLKNVLQVILKSKILNFFLIIIILNGCSLHKNSGFWTKDQSIKKENSTKVTKLFIKKDILKNEFNPNIKINLSSEPKSINFINNLNNSGRVNYNGDLNNISRFKFSKIKYFDQYEADLSFHNQDVIFFNDKGSILKFDKMSNLIWEHNYYSKRERKKKPFLFFGNDNNTLIVADNTAKYYALNIKSGNLLWMKTNDSPFNSEIKMYKDKFFVVDFTNTLRCFSIIDGSEIWNFKTTISTIKSQKKSSILLIDNIVFKLN